MNYKDLDEYVADYGFDNQTGIDDLETAMHVNRMRKDRQRENDAV